MWIGLHRRNRERHELQPSPHGVIHRIERRFAIADQSCEIVYRLRVPASGLMKECLPAHAIVSEIDADTCDLRHQQGAIMWARVSRPKIDDSSRCVKEPRVCIKLPHRNNDAWV